MVFTLYATTRHASAASTRAGEKIPAVLYGADIPATSLAVDYRVFEKLYRQVGDASLIDLTVDDQAPAKILVQAVQIDPVKGRIIHADFRRINMNLAIQTTLRLHFTGESTAVRELGGTLVRGPDIIHVKCLPKDLVSRVEVDIANLKTFTDVIRIGDLHLPSGIMVFDNPQTLVAKVTAPLTEEQLKALDEAPAKTVEDIEVKKKGKKEEEEGAEGVDEGAESATGEAKGEKSEKKAEKKSDK